MDIRNLDISKFLPHRPPFLMVDNLITLDENHVSTSFTIKPDCVFINNNMFNELGLVENAAQTCSAIVGKSYFKEDDLEGEGTKLIGFISAIKTISIHACPKVGETIVSKASLISKLDLDHYSICKIKCLIYKADKELLSCEMNLFIQELK